MSPDYQHTQVIPESSIDGVIDFDRFPMDRPASEAYARLVERCRSDLARSGMFNLFGLLVPEAVEKAVAGFAHLWQAQAFTHARRHNIYFEDRILGLGDDHPALAQTDTVNHTLCGDQIKDNLLTAVYEYGPLRRFLAEVMEKPELYCMEDPLARLNVMAYREGEALNWHFDRSEFTTTLLLQAPRDGGGFQYRRDLRTETDPNYEGVAQLLGGDDPNVEELKLSPGTLNVFRGKNTAHRVTPVEGDRDRIVAVFSYYDRPGVLFSAEERIGFYGREN